MSSLLPVLHFQQSDEGYCLPACARMVLSYLGLERDEAGISQIDFRWKKQSVGPFFD